MVREEGLNARPSELGSHVTAIMGVNDKLGRWEMFARKCESWRHTLGNVNQDLA